MAKMTLNEQAQEIIRIAEESGVQSNFFFITTFKRYQVQLNMLTELEKKMKDDGMLVTKEYVKGRKNLYFTIHLPFILMPKYLSNLLPQAPVQYLQSGHFYPQDHKTFSQDLPVFLPP